MRNLMILAAFGAVACAKGAEGDACSVDADCGEGLVCEVATTTATTATTAADAEGTCVATATGTTTTMTETMTETTTAAE
jgi:hypothetical protein